ncbi:MAG: hypothetical protein ABI824_00195 [Acidobacteriota bacterium]
MNRFAIRWMAVAGALLAPVVGFGKPACSRAGLSATAELYVAAQMQGDTRRLPAKFVPGMGREVSGLPVAVRLGVSENFGTGGGLWGKPLKIDQHRNILDATICEAFTEGLVTDKVDPYAFGTRLHIATEVPGETSDVPRDVVGEIEIVWASKDKRDLDRSFDVDSYLRNSSTEDWSDIPAATRDTRDRLQSVANTYLDALLKGQADVEPWGLPCARPAANGSCQVSVPSGTVNIENRHYVIDETIGAIAVFCTLGVDPTSGRIRTPDLHVFRVENGKVRYVHAITHPVGPAGSVQAKAYTPAAGPAGRK